MFRIFFAVLVASSLVACASGSKKFSAIDQGYQDPALLQKLCDEDLSGACALRGYADVRLHHRLPILQGLTSSDQSRFTIVAPRERSLGIFLLNEGRVDRIQPERISLGDDPDDVLQFEAYNLKADRGYTLVVIGPDGELWDRRTFRTLDTKKKKPRLAVVSCMDDLYTDIQARMWPQLIKQNPDVVLFLGDNVYADKEGKSLRPVTSKAQIWRRYAETRHRLSFFKAPNLIPVIATWDDHDFGKNDGDRTFPLKNESAEVFFTFFNQRKEGPDFDRGPGVSSWWSAFGLEFALLDNRSFRSPVSVQGAEQSHFGLEQSKWIEDRLKSASGPVLLASGDQFFGGYHTMESFEGNHPLAFKEQLKTWRNTARPPVLFLSGDRHLFEILKVPASVLGYETFEITSSAIHAAVFPDAFTRFPSPAQVTGVAGQTHFAIVDVVESSPRRIKLDVLALGLNDRELARQTLTVKRHD